jgi:hypothetical protein
MARSRKEEYVKEMNHGDLGFVGEREKQVSSYDQKEWGCVDKALMGEKPNSNIETIRCSMSKGGMDNRSADKPVGPEPMQKGPGMGKPKRFAMGGVGKIRKGEY